MLPKNHNSVWTLSSCTVDIFLSWEVCSWKQIEPWSFRKELEGSVGSYGLISFTLKMLIMLMDIKIHGCICRWNPWHKYNKSKESPKISDLLPFSWPCAAGTLFSQHTRVIADFLNNAVETFITISSITYLVTAAQ